MIWGPWGMSSFVFDHVEPAPDFTQLPVAFKLTTSRSSAVVKLMMLAPMMKSLISGGLGF